jgi:hypothetical protein
VFRRASISRITVSSKRGGGERLETQWRPIGEVAIT